MACSSVNFTFTILFHDFGMNAFHCCLSYTAVFWYPGCGFFSTVVFSYVTLVNSHFLLHRIFILRLLFWTVYYKNEVLSHYTILPLVWWILPCQCYVCIRILNACLIKLILMWPHKWKSFKILPFLMSSNLGFKQSAHVGDTSKNLIWPWQIFVTELFFKYRFPREMLNAISPGFCTYTILILMLSIGSEQMNKRTVNHNYIYTTNVYCRGC
jgi:hypothetical protein